MCRRDRSELTFYDRMDEVRSKLQGAGLTTYDCLSPALMDMIATAAAKKAGTFKAK